MEHLEINERLLEQYREKKMMRDGYFVSDQIWQTCQNNGGLLVVYW